MWMKLRELWIRLKVSDESLSKKRNNAKLVGHTKMKINAK